MRAQWWAAGLSAALAVAGLAQGRPAVSPDAGAPRAVAVRYTARLPRLPAQAGEVRVWIPLAQTSAEQIVHERTIHAPSSYTVAREPVYGNEILHVALRPPFPPVAEVSVEYRASLRDGRAAGADEPALAEAQRARLLAAEGLVIIDEEVRERAALATAGRADLPQRARGIYEAVIARMAYDKQTPGWGRGDTRRACLLGKGNCTDFHSLFISMARAQAIPARFKIGVIIPEGQPAGELAGYHCWAEFYEEGRGWVSVDASEAWKHPQRADRYFGSWEANRFLISTGRSLELVPRQRGEPVNIFFSPYAEVDGAPWGGVETQVSFATTQEEAT